MDNRPKSCTRSHARAKKSYRQSAMDNPTSRLIEVCVTLPWREPDSNHRYRSYERVSRLLPNGDAGPISRRLVGSLFEIEDHGPRQVADFAEPQRGACEMFSIPRSLANKP